MQIRDSEYFKKRADAEVRSLLTEGYRAKFRYISIRGDKHECYLRHLRNGTCMVVTATDKSFSVRRNGQIVKFESVV